MTVTRQESDTKVQRMKGESTLTSYSARPCSGPVSKQASRGKASTSRAVTRWVSILVIIMTTIIRPTSAEACISPPHLSAFDVWSHLSIDQLLFWSSYDFSVDAATQLLGPLDVFLRSGEVPMEEAIVTPALVVLDKQEIVSRTSHLRATRNSASSRTTPLSTPTTTSHWNANVTDHVTEETTTLVRDMARGGARSASSTGAYRFSLYQTEDGSETDPDGIPTRYLLMFKGRRDLAKRALEKTVQWRKQEQIDSLLARPHVKFDVCKQVFPHYFLGRDEHTDRVVFFQRPAYLNLTKSQQNGLSQQELLQHYIYVNEYLWQIVESHDALATMTSIIDLSGLKLAVLRQTEIINFLKVFVSTMDSHYPQRAHKTLLINAPRWFNALYKFFSPLLRETTKSKISISSRGKKQDALLKDHLGIALSKNLPKSVWSKHKKKKRPSKQQDEDEDDDEELDLDDEIPITKMEQELRSFVLARIKDAGKKMQPVV